MAEQGRQGWIVNIQPTPQSQDMEETQQQQLEKLQEENEELRQRFDEAQREKLQLKEALERMQSEPCNSQKCANEFARRALSVLGQKLQIGSSDMTVTDALQSMDKKLEMLLESSMHTDPSHSAPVHPQCGPCENDACAQKKDSLQKQVDNLMLQLHGPKCQRPECVKLQQDMQQKQVAKPGPAVSVGKEMEKVTGGDYGQLITRFEALTTSPDGLLGELESVMEPFEAKQMVSKIFKLAYNQSRMMVYEAIKTKLEVLFALDKDTPKEEMEDASRGYGRLLHASGVIANQAAHVAALTQQICGDLQCPESTYHPIFRQIFKKQPSILTEAVELAWEMVTLPNPMVISEPDAITEQTHEREFGYWDPSSPDAQLIYLRPVVYRSYQGDLACKAWVANSKTAFPFETSTSGPHQNPQAGGVRRGSLWSCLGFKKK